MVQFSGGRAPGTSARLHTLDRRVRIDYEHPMLGGERENLDMAYHRRMGPCSRVKAGMEITRLSRWLHPSPDRISTGCDERRVLDFCQRRNTARAEQGLTFMRQPFAPCQSSTFYPPQWQRRLKFHKARHEWARVVFFRYSSAQFLKNDSTKLSEILQMKTRIYTH